MDLEDFNQDHELRDHILGINGDAYMRSGLAYFEIDLASIQGLRDNNFLDLESTQNDSPTIGEFIDFMENHPGVLAHGYAVPIERYDYRVSLEGVRVPSQFATPECLADFVDLCRDADNFSIRDGLYCWYD